jgi:hypothetical protein
VLFPQIFFIYLLDITKVLFLNTVFLFLNTLCPSVYKFLKAPEQRLLLVYTVSQALPPSSYQKLLIIAPSMPHSGVQTDENLRQLGLDYRLGHGQLPNSVFKGWSLYRLCLHSSVKCLGIHFAQTLRNRRPSYTTEYTNPWLTFNSCPVLATVVLWSSRTTALASSSFSLLVYVERYPKRSAPVTLVQPFLNISVHLCESLRKWNVPILGT